MAPILNEAEAPVAASTTTAPTAPFAKAPTEAPARPQPVVIEIPVTVNGARTVDGSDKREPFSEATRTVLIFPHGTVVRISTLLVPGQLVFLTNEKTKKEVVCQVVKSKAGGAASGYVELQFTEPAAGFWGLPVSHAPAAPVAPRSAPPTASESPKVIPQALPVEAKPVAPKPVTPVATFTPPAKPVVLPPPPPVAKPEPTALQSAVPADPAPRILVAPPPPIAAAPEPRPLQTIPPVDAVPQTDVTPVPPPAPVNPPAPVAPKPVMSTPALHDYSKEIDALFAAPHAPGSRPASPPAPEPNPVPASAAPSSEELKRQAARLQAQLSSLLFTETPTVPPAPSAPPVTLKTELPAAEVADKVLEIAQDEPKPVLQSEPMPGLPVRKPIPASLFVVEEVKIPAWLAPLSQTSESSVAEPAASGDISSESASGVSLNSQESSDAVVVEETHRSQTAVFGGQLLGESSAQPDPVTSAGSKKGLFLGLAAAALLILGGAWHFRQYHSGTSPLATVKPVNSSTAAPSARVSNLPVARAVSSPTGNTVNPPPATSPASLRPARNSAPVSTQAASVTAPKDFNPAPRNAAPALKNSNPVRRNAAPVERLKKSPLGDVHLAAPVVNRGGDSQQDADALPAMETDSSSPGADPLAAFASVRHKQPVAPLPVGGDVKPAQLLKSVPPAYPMVAKQEHISGNVKIDALIDTSGNVAAVNVLSGPPILYRAAQDAVKQWKYSPAQLNGQPTSMHLTVIVQFRAQ